MNNTIYIHYGNTYFDPKKGFPIKNEVDWSKPIGGLWASRKNASFGWKDWCAVEEFRECNYDNSFEFIIKDESKVSVISSLHQLHLLPKLKNQNSVFGYHIDFERCVQSGIDAIELCWYGNEYKNVSSGDLNFALTGWDCDSIVVLNPDAVIPLTDITNKKGGSL